MNRREFIQTLTTSLCGCSHVHLEARAFDILSSSNDLKLFGYLNKFDMNFGSAFDVAAISDISYGDLLENNVDILTTDYNLKFKPLRRFSGVADFTTSDKLIDFAASRGKLIRGHALIWNEFNPDWLNNSTTREVKYWHQRHIEEVVGRYQGKMHSWDVVNEPFWPGHNNNKSMRGGVWYRALGESYIKKSFDIAYSVDKNVSLVLNEAWVERGDRLGEVVRYQLINLIDNLLSSGTQLHAIGLQCHLKPSSSLSLDLFSKFLIDLERYSIDVYITELDVDDEGLYPDPDKKIALIYRDFFSRVRQHKNVKIISVWQLSDKYSFYREKYRRPVRGLFFDEAMKPKLVVREFISSFS